MFKCYLLGATQLPLHRICSGWYVRTIIFNFLKYGGFYVYCLLRLKMCEPFHEVYLCVSFDSTLNSEYLLNIVNRLVFVMDTENKFSYRVIHLGLT